MCKNDNSFNGNFEFKAYQFGFDSPSYQWDCKDGEVVGETNEAKVTCNYTILGEHTPTLKINGELCSNQTTVKVTTVSSCSILARKASTVDKEEFSKSASIAQGDLAEAKINRQCLDGGVIKWTLAGGTRTYENGDNITISPSGATDIKISAQITKDNKTYGCGSADIKVTEKVKWR